MTDFEDKKELASDRLTRLKIELGIQEEARQETWELLKEDPTFQLWEEQYERIKEIKQMIPMLEGMIKLVGDVLV